jgi:predicted molibdopterin-dependent oxidoreductase YjgC
MKDLRVQKGVARGKRFEMEVDGETITAYEGETIAAALTAAGRLIMNCDAEGKDPRGFYCGIGLCWSCLIEMDDVANVRACQTLAAPGCRIRTQRRLKQRDTVR